jgi:hypothetical protein
MLNLNVVDQELCGYTKIPKERKHTQKDAFPECENNQAHSHKFIE